MAVMDTVVPNRAATDSDARVLFICPAHWGIRNVVHSGMAALLRSQGVQVFIATASSNSHKDWYPENGEANLKKSDGYSLLGDAAADVDGVYELLTPPKNVSQRGWASLTALQRASYVRRHNIIGERNVMRWYNRNHNLWQRTRNLGTEIISVVASQNPFYRWQNDYIEQSKRRAWDLSAIEKQIKQINPSLIVATSCVIWVEEPYVMVAKKLGIPTLGCIQSFDNLSSRSFIPDCDYYAVWNQRMKDQLYDYYPERRKSQVHVTGTAQFDFHVRPEFRWSREETLAKLGLNSGERYLLYAANSFHQTPTEPQLIEEFARRCAQLPELKDHRIIVRLHPQDTFDRWEQLKASSDRILISYPSKGNYLFVSPEDQMRLVSSLAHADVSLNMWSTMSLDSAAVDTPVVCVGFAGERGGAEDRFCHIVYNCQFYVPIVDSGGVHVAWDMDQLVSETLAYVKNRSRDQSNRKKLVMAEVGPVDGHAAERIAALVASITAAQTV